MCIVRDAIEEMMENGKRPKDIEFVCWEDSLYFTWNEFASIMQNRNSGDILYNKNESNEYTTLSADRLRIVGKDWWLEREEYDGSEWWEFRTFPQKPLEHGNPDFVRF